MNNEEHKNIEFDALTAGIENGGLRSKSDIYILCCYLLAHTNKPVTKENIVTSMTLGKIANYFEISSAVSKMVKIGNFIENEDKTLTITKECSESTKIVENYLPLTIRKRSLEYLKDTINRELYITDNDVSVKKEDDNSYTVILANTDLLELKIKAPNIDSAEHIKEKFLEKPFEIYEGIVALLYK